MGKFEPIADLLSPSKTHLKGGGTAMQLIQERQEHGILRLMLNDNARRNALSMDMLGQLQAALDQAGSDPAVRVIVLAATGPAFSAGHDLKEMTRARETPGKVRRQSSKQRKSKVSRGRCLSRAGWKRGGGGRA